VFLPTQAPPLIFRITRPPPGKIEVTIFLPINKDRKEFLFYLVVALVLGTVVISLECRGLTTVQS
jgi:hypothetical protein